MKVSSTSESHGLKPGFRRILLVSFIFISAVFSSCKRREPTTWDSDIAAPMLFGRLSLENLVADSFLVTDETGLWHLKIHENLTDFDLDTLVDVPDTVISRSFVVPITGGPFQIPAGQLIIDEEENSLLSINDVQLREVELSSGILQYKIVSYIDGYLDCKYELPGVTLNGAGTTIQTTTQPYTGSAPYIYEGEIDLANYRIDLTGENGLMRNRIYSHLTIRPQINAPSPTFVSANDSVVIQMHFIEPRVRYARGYFGNHFYALSEEVDFAEEINLPDGLIDLEEVSMQLRVVNPVGADARILFSELSNLNSSTGQTTYLDYAPLYQTLNITRAMDENGNVIPSILQLDMNSSNSNVDAFIENLPDKLQIQAGVIINPMGDVSDANDFIYIDKPLSAEIDLDIPLNLGMSGLILSDTLDLKDEVSLDANGELILYVSNGFPFSASCDIIALSPGGGTGVILQDGYIESAIPTGTYSTIPMSSEISIPVNPGVVNMLKEENRVLIRFTLHTPNGAPAGIYAGQFMDFRLLANGQVTFSYE